MMASTTKAEASMMPLSGGLIEDEMELNMEFEMDSEVNRRILASGQKHISLAALKKNSIPCSRKGSSYYNCRPGAKANQYSRGCNKITRCRR